MQRRCVQHSNGITLEQAPLGDLFVNPAVLLEFLDGIVDGLGQVAALLGGHAVLLGAELNLGLQQLAVVGGVGLERQRSIAKASTLPASRALLMDG